VLPGIRDDHTLELLSKLSGEYDDTNVWTETWSQQQSNISVGGGGFVWVRSQQQHASRRRVIPFDEIADGNPLDPSEVLHYGPQGIKKLRLMKYWTGSALAGNPASVFPVGAQGSPQ
jgi:hypothetical protein